MTPSDADIPGFKAQFARDFVFSTGQDWPNDTDISRAFSMADLVYSAGGALPFYYLAAHFLVTAHNGQGGTAAGGVTSSVSADGLSESYAVSTAFQADRNVSLFAQTSYGQMYLQLVASKRRNWGGVYRDGKS